MYSNAVITRSFTDEKTSEIRVGEQVRIHLDLKNHRNDSIPTKLLSTINSECDLHSMSYYSVGGDKFQF